MKYLGWVFAAWILLWAASPAGAQDVAVELEQFGVGSAFRGGSFTAIRVRLTSALDDFVQVRVQWEVKDADGDIAGHSRIVTLAPNQPASRWLYAWLSPNTPAGEVWTVRVYEEVDGRLGSELGATRISSASAIEGSALQLEPSTGMIGVIGQLSAGLNAYQTNRLGGEPGEHPYGSNEATAIVNSIDPRSLPDRWEGLEGFEALVWTDANPQLLAEEESKAVKEYIRRGGHLVIVLPSVGNPWSLGEQGQHHLADILPTKAPQRQEGVPITELTSLLSKSDSLLSTRFTTNVHLFDPASLDNHYEPFLALPCKREENTRALKPRPGTLDGRVVAVQRTLGMGRITLVGINVADPQLPVIQPGMPQADAFWNRILGRRADTPTSSEIAQLEKEQQLVRTRATPHLLGGAKLVGETIGMSGQAAIGILTAVVLFAVYWLAAGPGGFALLRQMKQIRHSWLLFVAMALLFTGIAWGGVSLLGKRHQGVQHLTVLNTIYRPADEERRDEPQYQSASVWFSVGVSHYGQTHVSIASDKGQRDLLTSWSGPGEFQSGYPDIDRYDVPLSSPADFFIPARATESQLYGRWMGAIDPAWGSLSFVDPENPLRVSYNTQTELVQLTGTLVHRLPLSMTDVTIIHINPRRLPLRRYRSLTGIGAVLPLESAPLLNYGAAVIAPRWDPGQPLDLQQMLYPRGPVESIDRRLNSDLKRYSEALDHSGEATEGVFRRGEEVELLRVLSLYHMMEAPEYEGQVSEQNTRLVRRLGRELDLSPWFTRPCLIVMGFVKSGPSPVPIRIDGEAPENNSGLTMIRWIHPLPLVEDEVPQDSREPR